MRIHLLSDLHNEHDAYKPQYHDADIVILAGDIDVKARGVEWAKKAFQCPVLYVLGNNEYYGGHMPSTLEKMRSAGLGSHVQVLERDAVIISGTRFLGATMWTDFSATGNKPLASITAQSMMNYYRQIRAGEHYRRIKPGDFADKALKTRSWLQSKLAEPFPGQTVVITHHAPLMRSLAENPHSGGHLDAAYANEWIDLMGGDRVALWVHGHSHTTVDYHEAGTRIVCNPRGYPGERTGFNPQLIINL
ncbi:metallophosphoesterase family protein [Pseudomonas sp. NPDC079086]|uniref:metallophosphoesterase family protein n=1 Tax=unclassified Pseudomonas TaxID=196821 RepID=UPI0037C8DFEB